MSRDYLNELFGLEGKVAVATGGTGELVGAMSEGLALAGAKVLLCGRNEEKANARIARIREADPGAEASFCSMEVTARDDLQRALDTAVERYGRVDIVINGAGVNSPTPFFEITEDEIDRILGVNLKSMMIACQVFARYFLDHNIPGSILNLGSMSGLTPLSRVFTYSVSKAGVINLTQNLAREWAPRGIRVNCLSPGFFPAEQNRKVLTPERVQSIMGHTPMNRFGNAGELIGATLLLASNKAASFITGANICVDGGFAAMTI